MEEIIFDPFPKDQHRQNDHQEADDDSPTVRIEVYQYHHHKGKRHKNPQQHQPHQ